MDAAKIRNGLWLALIIAAGAVPRLLAMDVPFFYHHQDDWAVFGIQSYDMLHGQFRAFMYRQAYIGTFPLLLNAVNYLIFGVNYTALGLTGVVYWAGYVAALYFAAKKIFGDAKAGFFAACAGALMPKASFFLCPEPSRGYIEAWALGLAVWVLTLDILSRREESTGRWAALGLIGGLAFWTSFFSGYFLLPAAMALMLGRPRAVLTRHPYVAALCFAAGSFPFWVHNLVTHDLFVSFGVFDPAAEPKSLIENLKVFAGKLGPTLALDFSGWGTGALSAGLILVHAAAAATLGAALARGRRGIRDWRGALSSPRALGIAMLFAYLALVLWTNISSSKYAGRVTVRYAMTVYPFVQIALGFLLARLWERKKILFAAATGVFALAHVLNLTVQSAENYDPRRRAAYAHYRAMVGRLADFVLAQGGRYVSTPHKWNAVILTFDLIESGVKVLEPVSSMFARETAAMDAQEKQFRLERTDEAYLFEGFLAAVGMRAEKKEFFGSPEGVYRPRGAGYNYYMYHDFRRGTRKLRALGAGEFSADGASADAQGARFAADGQFSTAWRVPGRQTGPEWIAFACTRPVELGQVVMFYRAGRYEPHARRFVLESSEDGRAWTRVREVLTVPGMYAVRGRFVQRPGLGVVMFDAEMAAPKKYFRIVSPDAGVVWRIGEIFLLEAQKEPGAPEAAEEVLRLLRAKAVETVYADEPLAAQIMARTPLRCFGEYGRDGKSSRRFNRREMDFSRRTAVIVDGAYAEGLKAQLEEAGLAPECLTAGDLAVFIVPPDTRRTNLFWLSLTAVRYWDPDESLAFWRRAEKLAGEGHAAAAAHNSREALRLDPGNARAHETLARLASPPAGAAPEKDFPWRPETEREILWPGLMRVAGYTFAPAPQGGGKLAVLADFERDYRGAGALQVFCLSPEGKVLFSRELSPFGSFFPGQDFAPEKIVRAGRRVPFYFDLPALGGKAQVWVCFLDAKKRRVPPAPVDGKKAPGNRVMLFGTEL